MPKKIWEQKVLRYICEYWEKHSEYPTNGQMAKFVGSMQSWCNLRRRLYKNEKLKDSDLNDFQFFDDSILEEYRKQLAGKQEPIITKKTGSINFSPVEVPIYGEVRAGTDRGSEDLWVEVSPSGDNLLLPDIDSGQAIYALEVTGDSMISDHILPGDFIIVEKISPDNLKLEDLIVTKYLNEEEFLNATKKEVSQAIEISENFMGPTLKYYSVISEGSVIRLSPKNRDPQYTIKTKALKGDELGRVVAVHRTIRKL